MRTLLAAAFAVLACGRTAAAEERIFPVRFHVATVDGEPVASRDDLEAWLDTASGLFSKAGVAFVLDGYAELPEGHAELADIRARRALRRFLGPRAIHVFVVERIRDPTASAATRRAAERLGREPTGWLSGAHIPAPRAQPGTYLIVTRRSGALTLTHELGHYFGAPHHADPENLMSYGRDRRGFDERQVRTFEWTARRFARQGLSVRSGS